ncbi:MAG: GNAT family N-acetyltransferase [Cyclobacteriaceae bacterium]|nr:GNAT family N-acetyltransferase [Cyclobacteriaceae bacterium]MCH8514960.1 GNAT family N-acetyltransferase [Cyclobacteriaceae bacterium]
MISIRPLQASELAALRAMAYRIWPPAFASILSKDQISYMLDWMYNLDELRSQYARGVSFIWGCWNENAVGFAAYEVDLLPQQTKLHKIYLDPNYQNKGIGKALIEHVLIKAKQNNQETVFLNVNRENKAIDIYQKLGFEVIRTEDNPIGGGYYMNDFVMEKTL